MALHLRVSDLARRRPPSSDTNATKKELGYQSPAHELRNVFSEGDSDSSDDERRQKLYIMYGGSWELASRRDVKTLSPRSPLCRTPFPRSTMLTVPVPGFVAGMHRRTELV